ncbi:hypothetical protein GN244_ATG09144 [Phytophthora infestans]|uniref:Uncharacterized protein n=1 Tax=Phytophthora infestans TaxID=4787 RepID=A0A833SV61_PHYIN|nr:hypothetical protein GN244_ATG09144 [Phytophthora infestans]KAF4144428.1 hypothetical protein GN958_ATG06359 [Phytophthora infestans]
MFIVTSVGNLPRDKKRYDEIGPGIFGLVILLAQQKQHWSAGLVKEQIEAISEISPRKMPGLSPWKATNGTFKLDLERIADSVRLSQLSLSIMYLGRGILVDQLAKFCVTIRVVRTTREFTIRYGGSITKGIVVCARIIAVISVVVSSLELANSLKTQNNRVDNANETKRKLEKVANEIVDVMESLRP